MMQVMGAYERMVELETKLADTERKLDIAKKWIAEISTLKGAYSMDHNEHAKNCLFKVQENCKEALAQIEKEVENV